MVGPLSARRLLACIVCALVLCAGQAARGGDLETGLLVFSHVNAAQNPKDPFALALMSASTMNYLLGDDEPAGAKVKSSTAAPPEPKFTSTGKEPVLRSDWNGKGGPLGFVKWLASDNPKYSTGTRYVDPDTGGEVCPLRSTPVQAEPPAAGAGSARAAGEPGTQVRDGKVYFQDGGTELRAPAAEEPAAAGSGINLLGVDAAGAAKAAGKGMLIGAAVGVGMEAANQQINEGRVDPGKVVQNTILNLDFVKTLAGGTIGSLAAAGLASALIPGSGPIVQTAAAFVGGSLGGGVASGQAFRDPGRTLCGAAGSAAVGIATGAAVGAVFPPAAPVGYLVGGMAGQFAGEWVYDQVKKKLSKPATPALADSGTTAQARPSVP